MNTLTFNLETSVEHSQQLILFYKTVNDSTEVSRFDQTPYLFDRMNESQVEKLLGEKVDETFSSVEKKGLLCIQCRNVVTHKQNAINVQGSHSFIKTNPSNIDFHLGCFDTAPGCKNSGSASNEFSWFAGYAWRISLCNQCGIHLGWYFDRPGVSGFYGLILDHLREEEDQGDSE